MSGFTSNTLLIRIQYCYQFKYLTDLIKTRIRMVNENIMNKGNCELQGEDNMPSNLLMLKNLASIID